jgi:hypothetical protein
MRDPEAIACDALACALAHEPDVRLIGNVTAAEVAALAARSVMTCPACGATAWVNIDCDTCLVCSALVSGEVP